jgi:hypothetical protein
VFGMPLSPAGLSAVVQPLIQVRGVETGLGGRVLTACVQALDARGLGDEGLFRISGDVPTIAHLRGSLERGEAVNLAAVKDTHALTGATVACVL